MNDKKQHSAIENEEITLEPAASAEQQTVTPDEDPFRAQFMRVSADFANYKRRMDKDRIHWATTGQVAIINAFLPIIDDIDRALDATRTAHADAAQVESGLGKALEGLELIEKNLRKTLDQLGVKEITETQIFDPHYHEALMQTQSDAHDSGQIVQVLSKGYTYKEVVIRHAKVSVAQ